MALLAYDPTRMTMVPVAQARSIAYVIDSDTGKRYSSVAEAENDIAANRQAAFAAFRQGERDSAPATTVSNTSQDAIDTNIETRRIATAQSLAQQAALPMEQKLANAYTDMEKVAAELDKMKADKTKTAAERAAELSAQRKEKYYAAQAVAKGTKPTPPPADANYRYEYVWEQEVGGPGGKWKLVRIPILQTGTKTDSGSTVSTGSGNQLSGNLIPQFNNGSPLVGTEVDASGWLVATYADGSKKWIYNTGQKPGDSTNSKTAGQVFTAPDGRAFTDLKQYNAYITELENKAKIEKSRSAFDLLYKEFNAIGLGALVDPLRALIVEGLPADEYKIRLRQTDAYKKRFAANAARIQKGLRALTESEYLNLEDAYQEKMRQYGLPESYYARGEMGIQSGFEKLIAGDVGAPELEERLQMAYNRVINANPEVSQALRQFYPDITNGDILAYTLDPENAREVIKRRVAAAEIGGAALASGFATDLARAENLQRYGITGEAAQIGYQKIGEYLPRASQLGDIYAKQGMGPFTQSTAEAMQFGLPSAAEATAKRKKLSELEAASFSGQAGVGALARERAGQF